MLTRSVPLTEVTGHGGRIGCTGQWWNSSATRSILAISLILFLLAAMCAPLVPLFDPDEGYYPATAAETLRSASFWDLRFNDSPRWEKPVLSYALIETAFGLFGETASAARLPSALEGAALIVIVGMLVRRLGGDRAGVLSAVVVATTVGLSIFSRVAHPELGVVSSIVATELLICLWLATPDMAGRRRATLGAGLAMGLGLLAKGPVAVVLPLLMLLCALPVLRLSKESLKSLFAHGTFTVCVATALACPWYAAMTVRHGVAFLRDALWQQNVSRYTTGMYGHRTAALGFLLSAVVGVLPWVGVLPRAITRIRLSATASPREVTRVSMSASALSAFVFYSLSSSKLPSYALVCVPPMAILIALALDDDLDNSRAMRQVWRQMTLACGVLAVTLLSAPLWTDYLLTIRQLLGAVRPQASDVGTLLAPVAVPLGCLVGAGAAVLVLARSSSRRIVVVACMGALAPILVLVTARPILQAMYPWDMFGELIKPGHGPVWVLGRRAPSLTFYARQTVSTVTDENTLEYETARAPEGWVVLSRSEWTKLAPAYASAHTSSTVITERDRMVLVRFRNH